MEHWLTGGTAVMCFEALMLTDILVVTGHLILPNLIFGLIFLDFVVYFIKFEVRFYIDSIECLDYKIFLYQN